ncbi:MAG: hypothetical protein Ta2E_12020 [Mycoplasmoidaceae bacterium]|nr:MAG: hypothetical protein Ta2E_12020 [Mycoplasmoidaceae bacterium]
MSKYENTMFVNVATRLKTYRGYRLNPINELTLMLSTFATIRVQEQNGIMWTDPEDLIGYIVDDASRYYKSQRVMDIITEFVNNWDKEEIRVKYGKSYPFPWRMPNTVEDSIYHVDLNPNPIDNDESFRNFKIRRHRYEIQKDKRRKLERKLKECKENSKLKKKIQRRTQITHKNFRTFNVILRLYKYIQRNRLKRKRKKISMEKWDDWKIVETMLKLNTCRLISLFLFLRLILLSLTSLCLLV